MRWSSRGRWWPRSRSSRSRCPAPLLERCCAVLADGPLVRVAPFRPWRARLIQTELPSVAAKVLDKTVRITRDRVEAVGGELLGETRCAHEPAPLAALIRRARCRRLRHAADRRRLGDHRPRATCCRPASSRPAGGSSISACRSTPATCCCWRIWASGRCWACRAAAARPSSTASTGCSSGWPPASRSPGGDIMRMGVGGLLTEIPSRPQPRDVAAASAGQRGGAGPGRRPVPAHGRPQQAAAAGGRAGRWCAMWSRRRWPRARRRCWSCSGISSTRSARPCAGSRSASSSIPTTPQGLSTSLRAGLEALPGRGRRGRGLPRRHATGESPA